MVLHLDAQEMEYMNHSAMLHREIMCRYCLNSRQLASWAAWIGQAFGLHFAGGRQEQLARTLQRRMRQCGLQELDQYRMLLDIWPAECAELAAELTVTETAFFRQLEAFRVLQSQLLPEIVRHSRKERNRSVRLWSAGCSTGQEAYSLAASIYAAIRTPEIWAIDVLGTDLNRHVLDVARVGVYARSKIARLTAEMQQSLGASSERNREISALKTFAIALQLRSLVRFEQHNLVGSTWPAGFWDIITCQNVLMYLHPDQRIAVLERLFNSLSAPGYLLIGPAELPTQPLFGNVKPVNIDGIFAYSRS